MKANQEILTLERLKAILHERGFRIVLREDGQPSLRGSIHDATPALLRVLGHYREEIIADLRAAQPEEVKA